MGFARLGVDLDPDLVFAAVMGLGRTLHGFLHRVEHDGFVDGFVARHRICDLQKLGPVGGNGHVFLSYCFGALRAFKSSSMSLSVKTSFASAMLENGNCTRRPWISNTTSLPSRPRSRPLKRLRPVASGATSSIFAS